jgi:hypothetical protein
MTEHMSKKVAIVLVNYKNYAEKYLADCIDSIRQQNFSGEIKVFIVDNETSVESSKLISKLAPEAKLILNKTNDGFAKGNNDAMKLAIARGFDYMVLFNMDTVVEKNCVSELVRVAEDLTPTLSLIRRGRKGEVGAVQARLMLWSEKNKINSLGNVTHFLGFGYAKGYGEKYNPQISFSRKERSGGRQEGGICYPSGAAVLYKAETLKKVGLFDEEFWMYNEDQDLGWRIWLAGFKCVLAPAAVVYHKYEFNRSIKKYYWMDRNRIITMLKNYHWATIALVTPACLLMEIGLLFFSAQNGWFKEKMEVYKYFLSAKNWHHILSVRKQIQKSRRVKDKDIIRLFSGKIWYQEIGDGRLKIANIIFNTYWQIIKVLIRW